MKLSKEKTEATTRAIITLFIASSLLIGLMSMSLSFTQTAMAQQGPPEDTPQGPPEDDTTTTEDDTTTTEDDTTTITATPQPRGPLEGSPSEERPITPQCQEGERFVPGEGCIGKECPAPGPGETVVEEGGQCFIIKTTKVEVPKDQCPAGFAKEGTTCRSTATTNPTCGPQTFNTATGKCEVTNTNPRTGETTTRPTDRDPCPAENDKLEGTSGSFTCRSTVTTDERVCPTGPEFSEEGGKCFKTTITKTPVEKVDTEPRKPGQGNLKRTT
jgi:hypothetical protein